MLEGVGVGRYDKDSGINNDDVAGLGLERREKMESACPTRDARAIKWKKRGLQVGLENGRAEGRVRHSTASSCEVEHSVLHVLKIHKEIQDISSQFD